MKPELKQTKIAVTFEDGSLRIMSFLTRGRGNTLPFGAMWIADGWWERKADPVTINDELRRAFPQRDLDGNARSAVARYRLIEEADIPKDRSQRARWQDTGSKIAIRKGR